MTDVLQLGVDWLFTMRVEGIPCTKGSAMAFLMNRKEIAVNPKARAKVNMIEARRPSSKARYLAWTRGLYAEATLRRAHWGLESPLDGDLSFAGVFYIPRPKSRPRDAYCASIPDYDKLMRAVWDELQRAGVIRLDSRIVHIGEPNGKFYETDDEPAGMWLGLTRPPK